MSTGERFAYEGGLPGAPVIKAPRSYADVEEALNAVFVPESRDTEHTAALAEIVRQWLENAYNRGWSAHQSALSGYRPRNGGANPFWPQGRRPRHE